MKKQAPYAETEKAHALRNLFTVIALIILGCACSHFEFKVFKHVSNVLVENRSAILVFTVVLFFLCIGPFYNSIKRIGRFAKLTWRQLWNTLIYISLPFVAFRIWEAQEGISLAGILITLLVIFWSLSFIGPLTRRYTKENITPSDDQLYRERYAQRLAQLLHDKLDDQDNALNRIAITATWGAGKTDLIHRVTHHLNCSSKDRKIKFSTHLVCPWVTESSEEAHKIIIGGIDRALNLWSPQPSLFVLMVMKVLSFFGLKTPSKEINDILKSSDTIYNEKKLDLLDAQLGRSNQRVVVFIDDMERAKKKSIRKVFPALNTLKPLNNCCFIFAVDHERIYSAFDSVDEARGYINKIFDLQLSLPQIERRELIKLAKSEVIFETHPFLYRSIQNLESVYPVNPRTLKQWLEICKAKEQMFFTGTYEFEEKNFPAFFLKELIEYEYPGFESDMRSSRMDEIAKKHRSAAYSKFARRHYGADDIIDDDQSESETSYSEKDLATFILEGSNHERHHRLQMLLKHLESLIEQNHTDSLFSYSWACGGYTMIVGLPLKWRKPMLEAFLKNPSRHMTEFIEEAFITDDQVDINATSDDFIDYYFSQEIEEKFNTLHINEKSLPILITNINALAKHIQILESLPHYLESRHNSFLEFFGILTNLKNLPKNEIVNLTKSMILLVNNWANLLSFREVQGLLIRSKTGMTDYQIWNDHDNEPEWKRQIENVYQKILAGVIVNASTAKNFYQAYREIDSNGDLHTYFLHNFTLTPKKLIETALDKKKFSASFLDYCTWAIFDPKMKWDNIESYMDKKQKDKTYYSFLAMDAASEIQPELIKKHEQRVNWMLSQINSSDLRDWFKEKFLGPQITKLLKLP